jgi:hypothetical protein
VVVGDSNINRSTQKINKETLELNDTIDLMKLTNVYRIFYPAKAQYILFLAAMELSPK